MTYEQDETGSAIINGRRYRTGFLKAAFLDFTNPDEAAQRAMLRRGRRENVLHDGRKLYHYTSLEGFQGIVESKGFWASDSRFLNDAEELRHGIDLTASVISHLTGRLRERRFAVVLQAVRSALLEPLAAWPLIACFSTVRDSLEQWRGYRGGVCIGVGDAFEPTPPWEQVPKRTPMFYGPRMLPKRAFYGAREKHVLVMSIVRRFEMEYGRDRAAMSEWPDDHDQHYIDQLTRSLRFSLVSFKNPAFQQEAEARVVIYPDQAVEFGGLKFRSSRLGLIPYVCTGGSLTDPVVIGNVMIGPSPHQELVAASVRTFLDHHGYTSVPVDLSSVPYRAP